MNIMANQSMIEDENLIDIMQIIRDQIETVISTELSMRCQDCCKIIITSITSLILMLLIILEQMTRRIQRMIFAYTGYILMREN